MGCQKCDICPECLNEKAPDLWPVYYEQYYTVLSSLVKKRDICEIFLPTTYLVAHYIELWIKIISLNYGGGKISNVDVASLKGHRLDELFNDMVEIIDWHEFCACEDELETIFSLISYFCDMTNDDGIDLSMAMRYPTTPKGNASLVPCIFQNLDGECSKMNYGVFRKNIKMLLRTTYDIYDRIYEYRRGLAPL